MNAMLDEACKSALQFFGTMTASISHEINNVLAIINENAGLLEDFTLMADKGKPIEPDRVKALAGKITGQIRRGSLIVKNMNKFAHSVDVPIKRIELVGILELFVALSSRFASMRGVTLELVPPERPVSITTNDFFLENLLWLCLDFSMDETGQNKTVVIKVEQAENEILIKFTQLEGLKDSPRGEAPGFFKGGLLEALNGRLSIDMEAGELLLLLPFDINQ